MSRSSHCCSFVWSRLVFHGEGPPDNRQWGWAGLCSGLAYMSKATGIFLIPVFVIPTFCFLRWRTADQEVFLAVLRGLRARCVPSDCAKPERVSVSQSMRPSIRGCPGWIARSSCPNGTPFAEVARADLCGDNLPTMGSYLRSHSPSVIAVRLINVIRGESRLLLRRIAAIFRAAGLARGRRPVAVWRCSCLASPAIGPDQEEACIRWWLCPSFSFRLHGISRSLPVSVDLPARS